jgi:hypothetical protein
MKTIAITPTNESVIPFLRELLSNPAWVSKLTICDESDDLSKYNPETRQVINDVENGRNMITCLNYNDYLTKITNQ